MMVPLTVFRFPVSMQGDIADPVVRPQPAQRTSKGLLAELLEGVEERGQVVVHCTVHAPCMEHIRIWPTTYLVCRHTGHRSRLMHAEGIVLPPHWMVVGAGETVRFTLFFDGLPRTCSVFDLMEEIHEPGGFEARGISRNSMDVYHTALD